MAMEEDKGGKDMHKTGWKNIDLPPHLKKAREEQERLNQEKKDEDALPMYPFSPTASGDEFLTPHSPSVTKYSSVPLQNASVKTPYSPPL